VEEPWFVDGGNKQSGRLAAVVLAWWLVPHCRTGDRLRPRPPDGHGPRRPDPGLAA